MCTRKTSFVWVALLGVVVLQLPARCQSLPTLLPPQFAGAPPMTMSFSQSSSSDWLQGPQNYVALSVAVRARGFDSIEACRLATVFSLDLGARHSADSSVAGELRIGENDMFGEAKLSVPLGWVLEPFIAVSARTAVVTATRYMPAVMQTAALWDPVVSLQSCGASWSHSTPSFIANLRGGLALKQTRAQEYMQLTDNPSTPTVERYKAESGVTFSADLRAARDSTMLLIGALDLFTTFAHPDVWTLRGDVPRLVETPI
jgi:hypothetical protein